MKNIFSIALLCGLLLACSSTPVQRKDFLLSAPQTESQPLSTPAFAALQVADLRANRPYNTQAMIYRESTQRFALDPHNGFLAPPALQISSQTRERLSQTGLFKAVLPQGSTLPAQWKLEGELVHFFIDVSNPAKPAVALEIRYALSDENQTTSKVFLLSATQSIADASPEQAVIGFNRALNTILLQLEASLLAAKPL